MIKNYLKIAWRNILKSKGFSVLNILGLAIGLASAALILIWVKFEMSYDRFHTKRDRLYVAMNKGIRDNELKVWHQTPKPLGPALASKFPEIKHTTRYNNTSFLFTANENKAIVQGAFVDSTFLDMFDFPLKEGDIRTALSHIDNIVITESFAKRMFGETNVVGKALKIDSTDYAIVTGVLKDLPKNTRFQFNYLLPWTYLQKIGASDENWGNNSIITYVELTSKTATDRLNAKIKDITINATKNDIQTEVLLYSFSDWWLYSDFKNGKISGGRIEIVHLFTIIAIFILVIACINFMNLSTARSEKRAKEVGVRKVIGAHKLSLVSQFLIESVLLAFISGILSFFIVSISIVPFGKLVNVPLNIDYGDWRFWLSGLVIIVFTGILAGSYPAFFLSSFRPIKVLKGTFLGFNKAVNPRKFLVVFQFSVAIILTVCTFVVKRQIQYTQDRENGYDKDNLVYIFLSGDINKNFQIIKNTLLEEGIASSITRTNSPITSVWSSGFPTWKGKPTDDNNIFFRFNADERLTTTFGLELVKGRDLDLTRFQSDSTAALINEKAVKIMGFDNPIGQIIRDEGKEWHIAGVVKDFIMTSPTEEIKPVVMYGAASWFTVMHIKFNPRISTKKALDKAEQIFKEHNPNEPFYANFIDQEYAAKFKAMQQISYIANLFTFLAIFISCLGLFGLAAHMAENRTKEISIRKVLGASVLSLIHLLSKEFLMLVTIACAIAFPLGYWAMDMWLQKFDYHTNIHWLIFAVVAIGIFMITMLTVSSQALRIAITKPAKSLRDE